MPHFPRFFTLAVLVLILPTLTGCSNWRTIDQPVPEIVEAHPGTPLRVALIDGTRFDADSGTVKSDSLVVWIPPSPRFVRDPTTGDDVLQESQVQSIPLLNVSAIQVRNPSSNKGAVAGGVIAGAIAIALVILLVSQEREPKNQVSCRPFCTGAPGC